MRAKGVDTIACIAVNDAALPAEVDGAAVLGDHYDDGLGMAIVAELTELAATR